MAIEVIDDWQRRSVGRALLSVLGSLAKANGIDEFTALVAADNVPMQRAVRHAIRSAQRDGSEVEYVLDVEALGRRSDSPTARRVRRGHRSRDGRRLSVIRVLPAGRLGLGTS